MTTGAAVDIRIAREAWEFEQIHALNHRTFVLEIPRYAPASADRLIDRFHDENTYVIAVRGQTLVGMLAIRGHRPFALHDRVADLDAYLPAGGRVCELRLLAIERGERGGRLLAALVEQVWRHCDAAGHDVAIISATTRQLRLYRHLGFEPFGPTVGPPDARFQPMMLTRERFEPTARRLFRAGHP